MSDAKAGFADTLQRQLKDIERRLKNIERFQRVGASTIAAAAVPDLDTISSSSYTDGTHIGPAVTVASFTSGRFLLIIGADLAAGTGSGIWTSFEVKDANGVVVQAANDTTSFFSDNAGHTDHFLRTFIVSGLSIGASYTITAKYKIGGSVGGVSNRDLVVFPL
jgi:hypothetical protein